MGSERLVKQDIALDRLSEVCDKHRLMRFNHLCDICISQTVYHSGWSRWCLQLALSTGGCLPKECRETHRATALRSQRRQKQWQQRRWQLLAPPAFTHHRRFPRVGSATCLCRQPTSTTKVLHAFGDTPKTRLQMRDIRRHRLAMRNAGPKSPNVRNAWPTSSGGMGDPLHPSPHPQAQPLPLGLFMPPGQASSQILSFYISLTQEKSAATR